MTHIVARQKSTLSNRVSCIVTKWAKSPQGTKRRRSRSGASWDALAGEAWTTRLTARKTARAFHDEQPDSPTFTIAHNDQEIFMKSCLCEISVEQRGDWLAAIQLQGAVELVADLAGG